MKLDAIKYLGIYVLVLFITQTGCRVKCGNFTGPNCHRKYYWGYVPALQGGEWGWLYCKAKKNFGKLPDYAFVQYEETPEGTLLPTKGGIDPAGIGPYDQRLEHEGGVAYENDGCNGWPCRVPLIKVGTLKKIKDDPKAFSYGTYFTPYDMFDAQIEPDYAHIKSESRDLGCPKSFNCLPESGLTMKRMNELCYLASFRKKPDGKPGLSGSNSSDDKCNALGRFYDNKVIANYESTMPRDLHILPIYCQDPFLEDNSGTTYRDIYLDVSKDLTGNRDARRYVYAAVNIRGYEWDTLKEPSAYFLAKLKSPRGGIYNSEINLKNCNNFGKYSEMQKRICANVLDASSSYDGSVHYTIRFPIESVGSYSLELVKLTADTPPKEMGNYSFNAFPSNNIVYNSGKANVKNYTSQSRELNLTILDFPNSKLPALKDCKLDAFTSLEESLEDAYSLNERKFDNIKKEQIFKGLDFKIQNCVFEGNVVRLYSDLLDENQIVKISVKNIKNILSEGYDPRSAVFIELSNNNATRLAEAFANSCKKTVLDDNPLNTLALMVKGIRYSGPNEEILDLDANNNLEIKEYGTDFSITPQDKEKLKSPYTLMGGYFNAYTLPNVVNRGLFSGRVAFLLYENMEKNLKDFNISPISIQKFAFITLGHELGHIWSHHYMMGRSADESNAHQAFCTGKDECECIFRYTNLSNDWLTRINTTGAKFCESHRQIILNQLIRKF